jgi:TatD DNase family protein
MDGSPPHRHSLGLERMVFHRILTECARLNGRVLSIHSRGAADEVVDALEAQPGAGLPILHWFSGSARQLARAIDAGCWFSVGPAMVRSAKGRALVARMPVDRLLTETDAPFARSGDRPLFPWEATDCVPVMADVLGIEPDRLFARLKGNLASMAQWPVQTSRSA